MVTISLLSLFELCSIRIAYLMWTRRDVARRCWQEELIIQLESDVFSDIKNLPLPEQLQTCILKYSRPVGERLLSFLNLWLSKLPCETPHKWLLGYMLFDSLVLNADGLINQRKTAQTLLRKRVLHNAFAFRMACINFLEFEVLKLWIFVKEYFLNKIMLLSRQHLRFMGTTECEEVLFWISYCLSKENETDLKEVPHYKRNGVDWDESILQSAASSGNVACFDYFKNHCQRESKYDHLDIIKRIFQSKQKECAQPSFIFHFMLLNFEEKAKLFQKFPTNMVLQFLQWPLSNTFLENRQRIWDLIPLEQKERAFEKVSAILVHENILLNPFNDELRMEEFRFYANSTDLSTVAYCVEDITEIWTALWKNLSDSHKTNFLESFVFPDFTYDEAYDCDDDYDLYQTFETSGLEQKLLDLFLSNAEALLELNEGDPVKESLRSLVFKYMPEDFQDLDQNCISFLNSYVIQCYSLKRLPVKKMAPRVLKYPCNPVHVNYLNYIETILFSYRN